MTELDGELAWALSEAFDQENIDLPRAKIAGVARRLSATGYARPKSGGLPTLAQLKSMTAAAQRTLDDLFKDTRDQADSADQPAHRQAESPASSS